MTDLIVYRVRTDAFIPVYADAGEPSERECDVVTYAHALELTAEVKRLRTALEEIASWRDTSATAWAHDSGGLAEVLLTRLRNHVSTASAALAAKR